MSRIDHSPDWRRLCQAALFEVNRVKLVDRIAVARRAILRHIETGHSKSSDEQYRIAAIISDAGQSSQDYRVSRHSVKS